MGAVSKFFQNMRDNIEFRLGLWGLFAHKYAWLVIAISFALLVTLFQHLPNLRVTASTEDYLHENDPTRIYYDEFREQFGRDEHIIVMIKSDNIFELEFMRKLKAFHKEIEDNVPKLQEINSLINARNTRGEGDQLIVGELMEDFPQTQEELDKIRDIAMANPLYKNNFFTHDGRYAAIVLETDAYSTLDENGNLKEEDDDFMEGFDDDESSGVEEQLTFITSEENGMIVSALEDIRSRYEAEGFDITLGGSPPMIVRTMEAVKQDMYRFTAISLAIIGLLLAFMFKRVVVVLLPLSVAVLSVLSTLSLMAMNGIPMTIAGQIIPSFLVAIGVGNSVHIFSVFFQALNRGEGKAKSLRYALGHSGLAVIMTSLTTAGGLLSFTSASLKPVSDFGIITPIGILCSLFLSLVLLPALIAVFPMNTGAMTHRNEGKANKFLVACAKLSTHSPWKVIAVWVMLVSLGLFSIYKNFYFSHNPSTWFPEGDEVRDSIQLVNDEFDGGMVLEMLVDTGETNGIKNPEVLRRIDEIVDFAKTVEVGQMFSRQASSVSDVSKEIHKALNENRSEFYAIPDDSLLLSQELLLFENSGSDDLEKLVDSQFSKARVSIKIPSTDALHFVPYNEVFEPRAREIMGDEAELHFTGIKSVMGKIFFELIHSMANSYLLAIAIITPLMIFLIGSLRLGLLSMIPNLSPIIITLGLMSFLGIPMDAFTLLIGSIALGLAVDDTIHFMHNFQRYYSQSQDVEKAVLQTLTTTGHALLFTTVVLALGFSIYALSIMFNLKVFGLLTAFCVSMAFLADVLFAPALVTVVTRWIRK